MPPEVYLHEHPQFQSLIRIVAVVKNLPPALVEKDYWVMHCLYGLEKLGLTFELKGGTSLSKGCNLLDRFSEDIDIHIDPVLQVLLSSANLCCGKVLKRGKFVLRKFTKPKFALEFKSVQDRSCWAV